MTWYPREDAAVRTGVEPRYVDHLVELGVVTPAEPDHFSPGDLRRILLAKSLEDAAIPLDHVAEALRTGALTLDFLDAAAYERFATLAGETFQQVSDRTGVPLELVTAIREATGSPEPSPEDQLREDEMALVPFLELQVSGGFRDSAIEHCSASTGRAPGVSPRPRARGGTPRSSSRRSWRAGVRRGSPPPTSRIGAPRSRSRPSSGCTTHSRRGPGPPTSSRRSRGSWQTPASTAASRDPRPSASSTSPATPD